MTMLTASHSTEHRIPIPSPGIDVSAILMRPPGAHWLYVLAHRAGADMRHRSMEAIAEQAC
jgi:hypothetical protein